MTAWLVDAVVLAQEVTVEGDNTAILLLAGPVGAGAVYWLLYRYYRNTDKSHAFEKDTLIESKVTALRDQKFDRVTGTERSSIRGDNKRKHRDRVRRLH